MIRVIMWFCLFLLSLGFMSIDVLYKDGLHIIFHGHADRKKLKK